MATRTTATAPALTADQERMLERAREALAQEHGYDTASLAKRTGTLEWHLEQLLVLVGRLTRDAR